MALRPPPLPAPRDVALLLDFDGTLVELAPTPEDVVVDAGLKTLIARLQQQLDGALAIVSGRTIASIDSLLAPLRLPVAGQHGIERRCAAGRMHAPGACGAWLEAAHVALQAFSATRPGVLVERKSHAVALHWRRAPRHAAAARDTVLATWATLQPRPMLIEGHAVLELRELGPGKDAAIDAFLADAAFRGRRPVYIGDDITDVPALRRAVQRGGLAICVGPADAAWRAALPADTHGLSDPIAVRAWIAALLAKTAAA
ncbi:MAG: trehalose-phosphatase [Steroidobacteraceae bacterium]